MKTVLALTYVASAVFSLIGIFSGNGVCISIGLALFIGLIVGEMGSTK